MTTAEPQTVGRAVATRDQQSTLIDHVRAAQADFEAVLPAFFKPEHFVRLAVGALRRDPNLMAAAQKNPGSLMQALLDAARLGLEPGTKEYYLTPRGGKQPGVLGITGYQGEVELIYRAGAVSSIKAELVCAADQFYHSPTGDRPDHVVDWFTDRGEVQGAYAYAIMRDGSTSKVVVVGMKEIARAKEASPTASSSHSPWNTDYGAMVLKTAIHQLAKWVPTSAEFRREQLRAIAAVRAETSHTAAPPPAAPAGVDERTGEIVDGEVVE